MASNSVRVQQRTTVGVLIVSLCWATLVPTAAASQQDDALARGLGAMIAAYERRPNPGLLRGATQLVNQMADPSSLALLAITIDSAAARGAADILGTLRVMGVEAELAGLGAALASFGDFPQELRGTGLSATDGILYGGALVDDTGDTGQRIRVVTRLTTLGQLRDFGSGNTYEHIQTLSFPVPFLLQFVNRSEIRHENLVVTPDDVLQLMLNDGTIVQVSVQQDIVVPWNPTPDIFFNFRVFSRICG